MAVLGWIDPATDFEDWADAPEPADLEQVVWTAYAKCLAWAPAPIPEIIPEQYKYAQKLLTQHLWARKRAGDGEGFGADGFMISTYPLVREAFDALRPKRGPLAGLL